MIFGIGPGEFIGLAILAIFFVGDSKSNRQEYSQFSGTR